MDFLLVPENVQLRIFLLQLAEFGQHRHGVAALGQIHPVGHDRFQHRRLTGRLHAQSLTGKSSRQARHRHQRSSLRLFRGGEFIGGVKPQLDGLFGDLVALLVYITQFRANFQPSSGDFHPGQAVALRITGNFIYPRAEFRRVSLLGTVGIQQFDQLVHALNLQSRAKAAGKNFPTCDKAPEIAPGNLAGFQIGFQQCLVAHGGSFRNFVHVTAKIDAAGGQFPLELRHQLFPLHARQVHFVDEQKGGHVIPLQQPPKGDRVGLNAVGTGNHQHRAVQNGHGPFRLGGEIHVTGCIHQGDFSIFRLQQSLLGENGNASGPLQIVGVQIGIAVIHTAQCAPGTGAVKQCFRKCGLARVHMGHQGDIAWRLFHLFRHKKRPLSQIIFCIIPRKHPISRVRES